jgi:predicted metal-dependent phosphoesterase TrpH
LAEARAAAEAEGMRFVAGAELSVSWRDVTLHVVALGIDSERAALRTGLTSIRDGRSHRARRIADSLAAAGIAGAYEGAMKYVTSERLISRTHFARFLVETGHARETKEVFKRYLVSGMPGHVQHEWATMTEAISWIHEAGGQAVLAHPARYKVDAHGMRDLLGEFRDTGGDAIEVVSPSHTPGPAYPRPMEVAGQRLAVNICYEDAFGGELIRQLPDATLLVNFTNDAWYGHSLAAEQHAQMSAMRAIESARPMLRATNTGITSIIDHRGVERARLPWFTRGVLEGSIVGRTGTTPYVRFGDAVAIGAALAAIAVALTVIRLPRRSAGA